MFSLPRVGLFGVYERALYQKTTKAVAYKYDRSFDAMVVLTICMKLRNQASRIWQKLDGPGVVGNQILSRIAVCQNPGLVSSVRKDISKPKALADRLDPCLGFVFVETVNCDDTRKQNEHRYCDSGEVSMDEDREKTHSTAALEPTSSS